MASSETSKSDKHKQSQENDDYNPKLDFFSEQFDPLLALKTPNLIVPVSNARTYDNLSKYQSVVELKKDLKPAPKEVVVEERTLERRWLPHQLPVQTERKRIHKNVFTFMEKAVGPMQLLKICKEERRRIKVWTRHSHDIRGYCIAYLEAFDKHWNLALKDVDEVWTRKKRRKVPAFDTSREDRRIRTQVLPPKVTVISSTKKTETCSRHVGQMLIRGEHVAYIVVIPNK